MHPELPDDVKKAMREALAGQLRGLALVVACHHDKWSGGDTGAGDDPFHTIHLLKKRLSIMEHEVRMAGVNQMNRTEP